MRGFIPPLLFIAAVILLTTFFIFVNDLDNKSDPFGGYCFTVIDRRGEAHPSEIDPPTSPGLWAIYTTPEESGMVSAPYVVRVDMPCVEALSEPTTAPKGGGGVS